MDALFLHLLNMSLTASWLVLAVLLVRLIFRKAPKALLCFLWAIVAIRLICPFSIETAVSLIPSTEPIPQDILLSPAPQIDSGISVIDEAVNPIIMEGFAPQAGTGVNPLQVITAVAANLWILGMIAMLVYALISYIRVYRKTRMRLPLENNVYLCDSIDTPFIFGILRPHIYLPSTLSQSDAVHVLAHEQAHLKRRDHWWKPLGFALLTVYWFNPLLWIAYILLCRDIEFACDERVLSHMDKAQTAAYTEALLHCSSKQRFITVCPLAFGESSAKSRIKTALNYKKPTFWLVIVPMVACMALTVCFLTNPISSAANGAASELEDVSVAVEELDLFADQPHITVQWQNKSEHKLIYGEAFRLYRLEDGQLVDTALLDDLGLAAIGYSLTPHTSVEKTYDLSHHDLSQNGFYRFESTVYIHEGEATPYTLWANFEVKDGRISLPPIGTALSDLGCQHQWIHAVCTVPQTCMLCQITEGEPLGHDWADATCEAPQTCRSCAVTEGAAPGHTFENVTCTDGGICVRCGKEGTKTLPHTYSKATCTADAACTACGVVGTKALGHAFTEATCTDDGACSRCGEIGNLAYGHSYAAATCTEPATCTHCGDTDGEALGHSEHITCVETRCWNCWEYLGEGNSNRHMYKPWDGICSYCGDYDPDKIELISIVPTYPTSYHYSSDSMFDTKPKDPLENGIPLFGDVSLPSPITPTTPPLPGSPNFP